MPTCIVCGIIFDGAQQSKRCAACNSEHRRVYMAKYGKTWNQQLAVRKREERIRAGLPVRKKREVEVSRCGNELPAQESSATECSATTITASKSMSVSEWIASHSQDMKFCERLKIKSISLPCGEREECFGKNRCDRCPSVLSPFKTDME